jgi:hypothetical protein
LIFIFDYVTLHFAIIDGFHFSPFSFRPPLLSFAFDYADAAISPLRRRFSRHITPRHATPRHFDISFSPLLIRHFHYFHYAADIDFL